MTEQKTITVSPELYNAIQQLKPLFQELSWEEVKTDEEVIWILISWFVDSFREWMEPSEWDDSHDCKCWGNWKENCDCEWNCDCEKNTILLS